MDNHKTKGELVLSQKAVHDLRNALNSILGYAQMLQDEELPDEQKKMADSIENAAMKIKTLTSLQTNEVVQNSNVENNSMGKLKILIVDDNEDNREVLGLMLKKFQAKLSFASNGYEALEIASQNNFDLIFIDFHMPELNGKEASILIKQHRPQTKIAILSGDIEMVEKMEENQDLFDYYLSKPFNKESVKSIVAGLSHETQNYSSDVISLNNSKKPIEEYDKGKLEISNPKILIVDDKRENLTFFTDVLRPYSYDLSVAISGETALESLKYFHPDLILLDVMMPDMNGYEVLERIKRDKATCDIPVIFLTAKDTTEDIIKGFEAGAVDYIAKPFHPREMVARVNTHLEKAKLFFNLKKVMEHSFHELYTPLSVISSAMQMQELEFEKNSYTQMTLAACKTLQNIYDDIYYSMGYSSTKSLPSLFDLSDLIRERINYFQLVAESKELEFKVSLPDNMVLEMNPQEMARVVDNLISNALKYTKEGNKIFVSLDKKEGKWLFQVCNGVTKEIDVSMIFNKYYRQDDNVFGLGLGLDLVKSICEKNKIQIDAVSNDGKFCISLHIKEKV